MEWKLFATVFVMVFIAELGDKTQLATMLFAADREVSRLTVFLGASVALVASSAIGVAAGALVAEHVSEKILSYAAGVAFILVGVWTMLRA
jgi:putative Ca2+/H+ antiporter (TMEM165/GDT1 family)